jgi:hypothetical protein
MDELCFVTSGKEVKNAEDAGTVQNKNGGIDTVNPTGRAGKEIG